MIQGLQAARELKINQLAIYMDSQLIVKQVKGEYKVRHPILIGLYQQVAGCLKQFTSYQITFIPRKYNQAADKIVNQILDQHL